MKKGMKNKDFEVEKKEDSEKIFIALNGKIQESGKIRNRNLEVGGMGASISVALCKIWGSV